MDAVRLGRTELRRVCHIFRSRGPAALVGTKAVAPLLVKPGGRMEKISAALWPAIAAQLRFAEFVDSARRDPLSAHKSYWPDLSHPAGFAMAGARPLVLDSHVELSDE